MLDSNEDPNKNENEAEEVGGIFQKVGEKQRQKMVEKDALDEKDSSIFDPPLVRNWTSEEVVLYKINFSIFN